MRCDTEVVMAGWMPKGLLQTPLRLGAHGLPPHGTRREHHPNDLKNTHNGAPIRVRACVRACMYASIIRVADYRAGETSRVLNKHGLDTSRLDCTSRYLSITSIRHYSLRRAALALTPFSHVVRCYYWWSPLLFYRSWSRRSTSW